MNEARDRDAAVEQWLRHLSTEQTDVSVSDACLDPEVMAAWIDGRLAGAALAAAETHVAGCARCQAIAATIARTESIADWSASERRPRWRWLAWVVPLSAAATVAAVIFVARREDQRPQPSTQVPQVAESRQSSPPAERESAQRPAAKNENALAKSDQEKRAAVREEDAKNALRDKAPAARSTGLSDAVAPKRTTPPPPAAAPPAGAATAQKPASQARADESARMAELRAEQAGIGFEIRSPDPAVRWRIGRAGPEQAQGFARTATVVERSIDAGSTWTPIPTGVTAEITAGTAPSASVCWLVGRAGIVLLTTDGKTWERVTFPEASDLSAIRATDARSATVTTADGRQVLTTDGGRTWVRRQLQESETGSF